MTAPKVLYTVEADMHISDLASEPIEDFEKVKSLYLKWLADKEVFNLMVYRYEEGNYSKKVYVDMSGHL